MTWATIFKMFDSFQQFCHFFVWQIWQFSTVLTTFGNCWRFWQFFTNLAIFDNLAIWDNFGQFFFDNLNIFWQVWQAWQFLKIFKIYDNLENFDKLDFWLLIIWHFMTILTIWYFVTILTIFDNFVILLSVWQFGMWDTDNNSDNWEPEFMTIFVTWQLRVTLDSIRNSCDVFGKLFLVISSFGLVSQSLFMIKKSTAAPGKQPPPVVFSHG